MLYLQSSFIVCRYKTLQVGTALSFYITAQWTRPFAQMTENLFWVLSNFHLSPTCQCYFFLHLLQKFPLPVGLRCFQGISSHFLVHRLMHHRAMPEAEEDSRSCSCQTFVLLPARLLEGGSLKQTDSSPSPPIWHFSTPLLLLYHLSCWCSRA